MFSTALLLFFIIDPVGNVPLFAAVLGKVPVANRRRVLVRELCIALVALVLLFLAGRYVLEALHISEPALEIAGAMILLLIAIPMVFPTVRLSMEAEGTSDPFVVPLAIPLFVGPGAITMVMLIGRGESGGRWEQLAAVSLAWAAAAGVLLLGDALTSKLGKRGMIAVERVMGMLTVAIAVEMFLSGIELFAQSRMAPGA